MEADDSLPRRSRDLVAELARQDLDPFSVAELNERIDALQAEISRSKQRIERAVNHRASADALFKS
ncbi:MAG: DUF1192 domain-containing protein [Pseudomonadota bacterium]